MTWQLRATAGPLEGAVYVLRNRAILGRAGDCDIQIINDGVSRKHAKIVDESGRHVLVDLRSNNGTFVGDARVERHVLRPGDEFRIMRSRFVYEVIPEGEEETHSDVWAVKVTNGRTLRRTLDFERTPPQSKTRETPPDPDVSPSASAARPVARIFERSRLTALRHDGSPYRGDLVGDILIYRDLQLRMTRRDVLSPVEQGLLRRFTEVFRQTPDDPSPYAGLRRFMRFRCRFPARVRWLEGSNEDSATVVVLDFGVGGAKLNWRDHPMEEGVVAWLVIDVAQGARSRTLVFPTRVAWVTGTELGLQFAGVAEWEGLPA
ncbi:FHA domain-containing protein [Paraliomyxa miuraensis]|uniref:FHA domain-containing protein n=1 Tax=Paraliomyxa miuraensis TaxID=376150 RepID=UPI002251D822|nr:FHA domain-containing protein [Paraliomyxa miuraensis]MCX4246941.1 FHA domain-containing protein [Paraliomyxa miuraensis]